MSMQTAGMAEVAGKHLVTFPAKTSRLIFLQPLSRTSQRETSTRCAKPSILSPQNGIREKCAKLRRKVLIFLYKQKSKVISIYQPPCTEQQNTGMV